MQRYFLTVLSFTFLNIAFSVDFGNYKSIESSGSIPKSFLTTYDQEVEERLKEIDRNDSHFDKKAQADFIESSTYTLKNMLFSGKIIFKDPISNYVEKVGKEVLKSEPELVNKIQFFTIKSPSVNAFATDQGYVFVTMGLLAQLENEAQLAMILAHEATHVHKKHSINKYVENKRIQRRKGQYTSVAWGEEQFASRKYSKELEEEADKFGFDHFYKNSKYSYSTIDGVFDVLEYGYLPYDEVKFDKSFFEDVNFVFPEEYFLEEVAGIEAPEVDEDLSTHPNISKRRAYINKKIETLSDAGRSNFIISESEFEYTRKIARFEISELFFANHQYCRAIYNSYLNIRAYGPDIYNRKCIAKSMYVLAKYYNDYGYFVTYNEPSYEEVQGEMQQLYHFASKLVDEEWGIFASKYLWELHLLFPEEKSIEAMAKDILKETLAEHSLDETSFETVSIQKKQEQIDVPISEEEYQNLSKYDKIKAKKDQEVTEESLSFRHFAFVELFKSEVFVDAFDQALNAEEKEESTELKKLTKKDKRKGLRLGIDKIVFVDPNFIKLKESGEVNVKYSESEKSNKNLNEYIARSAELCDMEYEILDEHDFHASDVKKYNDYARLSRYMTFRNFHEDNDVSLVGVYDTEINELTTEYGTKYFAWTGYVSIKEKPEYYYLAYGIFIYPALPFVIYYLIKPHYTTMQYYLLMDVEKGEFVWKKAEFFKTTDSKVMVKATTHDVIYQTASKHKK